MLQLRLVDGADAFKSSEVIADHHAARRLGQGAGISDPGVIVYLPPRRRVHDLLQPVWPRMGQRCVGGNAGGIE